MTSSAKRAGEEADRLIASLAEQKKAAAAQPAAEPQPEAEPPTTTEPSNPDATQDVGTQSDVGVQPNTQSGNSEELALLRKEVAVANARWQSLQGMINKKDSELEQMRLVLAQINQKAEQPTTPVNLVTPKDEEDFGADMVDLARRVATEVFSQQIKDVNDRITKMEKSIAGVSDATTKIAEETFDEALTRQVPNWETIDKDPEFIAWLSEEEGFSGRTKLELLQQAYKSGNLKSTVAIFKAFEATKSPVASPVVTPAAEPSAPAANVVKYVVPGKSKSSTPPVSVEQKKTWSNSDISKLYDDRRNKRITEEDFVEQERDLFAAQREGRIAA